MAETYLHKDLDVMYKDKRVIVNESESSTGLQGGL